jgi:hypothetical protein
MKTQLDNITLISVCGNSSRIAETIDAAHFCCKDIQFKSVKILSNCSIDEDGIEVIGIPTLNKEEYSHFLIYDFPQYIDTEYCLTFQWDGFVINPSRWKDEFLQFDYIGAPWLSDPTNNVGNGGFSLRSQKFMQSAKTLSYNSRIQFQPHIPAGQLVTPEDWFVCSYEYEKMIDLGVKFADINTAYKFSVEHPSNMKYYNRNDLSTYNSFGFHGDFNIAAMKLLEKK